MHPSTITITIDNAVMPQSNSAQPHQPNLTELLSVLDGNTLSTLSARLHKVAEIYGSNPAQLLFEFVDEALTAEELTPLRPTSSVQELMEVVDTAISFSSNNHTTPQNVDTTTQ